MTQYFYMVEKTQANNKYGKFDLEWGNFLLFSFLTGLSLFAEGWIAIGGVALFGIVALSSFPHKETRIWLGKQSLKMVSLIGSLFKYGLYFLVLWVGVWFIGKVFGNIGDVGGFQGRSAKEWFYEYDEADGKYRDLYNCVEEYVYSEKYSALEDIQFNCL